MHILKAHKHLLLHNVSDPLKECKPSEVEAVQITMKCQVRISYANSIIGKVQNDSIKWLPDHNNVHTKRRNGIICGELVIEEWQAVCLFWTALPPEEHINLHILWNKIPSHCTNKPAIPHGNPKP